MDGYLSQLARRQLVALVVDHRHPMSWIRTPDGSGLHRPGGVAVAHHVIDLGLAEHFVDRHAELRLRPFDHRHADRFAGAHDASDIQ